MFRTIHTINSLLTGSCTLLYLTLYGLVLMMLVGFVQVTLAIILWFNIKKMVPSMKPFFIIYTSLTVITLSVIAIDFFNLFPTFNHFIFPYSLIPGGILSFYLLWITYRLKETQNHA